MNTKSDLRKLARANRVAMAAAQPDFAERIATYADALELPERAVIGGYVALPGEADPYLLLKRLAEKGHDIAFPRVVERNEPLAFHLWKEGLSLVRGAFGIPEPSPEWPCVEPRVSLVPLLAFDKSGYRIGYGGGFYDRTLAALAQKGETLAIGIGFAGQEIERVPHEDHDRRLDAIVTELGVRRFG